jgi:formylglycine-generating enzyme required for sulfatase activity
VSTEPSGASASVKRFSASGELVWQRLGQTPLDHRSLARGDYLLRLELAGREPFERSISSAVARSEFAKDLSPAIQVAVRLFERGKVPPRMTPVPGGRYKLVGYGQPTQATALLGDYFIDRYEVSNREYQTFVSAGGYRNRGCWRHPFVDGDRVLPWDEAQRRLVDRTGLPGPRGWSGGSPPEGQLDRPVTGVTWYEAAAYAAYLGKTLPTIYQWEKAARDGVWVVGSERVMPWGIGHANDTKAHANFEGNGTAPVESLEFGMSPYGCLNMAGNVTEWLRNEAPGGVLASGGCWADPSYIFGEYGTLPGLHSSDRVGFRCALTAPGVEGDQGGQTILTRDQAPVYARSSDSDFRAWLSHYRYDKTPLDARVEETSETPDWMLEKVTFKGGGDDRTYAYLYLPKSVKPPLQVIQFVPGSPVYEGQAANWMVESGRLAGHVKAGRALLIVALRGYLGREHPAGYRPPDRASVAYRDEQVHDATDLRRGLDYLETRPDIDSSRLALMNVSISRQGILFSAVEPRYRAVVLMASGLYPSQQSYIPEANPIDFAPHIKAPKLMLNGRWDEDFAFKTDAEPLFELLSEPKRLELYDGGHVPPVEIAVPVVNQFLDETLGPVRGE